MSTTTDHLPERSTPSPVQEKGGPVVLNDSNDDDHPVLVKDGFKMHPQPTSDPLDPLNWSWMKKHTCLAIVMSLYFMFTYITTTTVAAFPDLMAYYNISLAQVNWTVAIPALGLALGPLIWSSLADIYGRRLIFIVGTIMALASTIGAAKAPTYSSYMAARFFQGLGVAPASTVGLAIINDMFYEHERGQKVGLWVLAIDMGLLVGPLIGGFIWLVDQFWIQWLTAIFFGVVLIAELAFLPETLYPRNQMLQRMPFTSIHGSAADIEKVPQRTSAATEVAIPRTTTLPFINLRPVPGMRHPRVWEAATRFLATFKYAVVPIALGIYSFAWYWWILSIITYIPVAYAQYPPNIQGLLFIGLILGTLVSEIACSGTLSDWLMVRLARRNHTTIKTPESRLWLAYPAALLSALGLIIWGISIDRGYHWIVGQIAFFLFGAGIQMGNTIIAAYLIDCYPLQSMAMITFYAVVLNLSAFVNPFFIVPWVESVGYTWTFATQGILTVAVSVPCLAALHYWGARIRVRTGVPGWVNPEYDVLL